MSIRNGFGREDAVSEYIQGRSFNSRTEFSTEKPDVRESLAWLYGNEEELVDRRLEESLDFHEDLDGENMDLRRGMAWLDGELYRQIGRERLQIEDVEIYETEVIGDLPVTVVEARYSDEESPLKVDSFAVLCDTELFSRPAGHRTWVGDREDGMLLDERAGRFNPVDTGRWYLEQDGILWGGDLDSEKMYLEDKIRYEALNAWRRATDASSDLDSELYHHHLIQNSHTMPFKQSLTASMRQPELDAPDYSEKRQVWEALGVAMTDKDIDDFESIDLTLEDAKENPRIDLEYVQGDRSLEQEEISDAMIQPLNYDNPLEIPPKAYRIPDGTRRYSQQRGDDQKIFMTE